MVRDRQRIDYLTARTAALGDAVRTSLAACDRFARSWLDDFEWSTGYRPRSGPVHVDYSAPVRTPKDSYRWYQSVIGVRS